MCSVCGNEKVLMDGLCCKHLKQKCLICFDPVGSTNTIKSKRLTCGHSFHPECIIPWFVSSQCCPVCRADQVHDPLIIFKEEVEDQLRAKYKAVMDSLEAENKQLKDTLKLQSLFNAVTTELDEHPTEPDQLSITDFLILQGLMGAAQN